MDFLVFVLHMDAAIQGMLLLIAGFFITGIFENNMDRTQRPSEYQRVWQADNGMLMVMTPKGRYDIYTDNLNKLKTSKDISTDCLKFLTTKKVSTGNWLKDWAFKKNNYICVSSGNWMTRNYDLYMDYHVEYLSDPADAYILREGHLIEEPYENNEEPLHGLYLYGQVKTFPTVTKETMVFKKNEIYFAKFCTKHDRIEKFYLPTRWKELVPLMRNPKNPLNKMGIKELVKYFWDKKGDDLFIYPNVDERTSPEICKKLIRENDYEPFMLYILSHNWYDWYGNWTSSIPQDSFLSASKYAYEIYGDTENETYKKLKGYKWLKDFTPSEYERTIRAIKKM